MRVSRPLRCRATRPHLLLRRPKDRTSAVLNASNRGRSTTGSGDEEGEERNPRPSPPSLWLEQAVATAASGAVLGPLCDGLHSQYGVLKYARVNFSVEFLHLETTWWTPLLFALAGVIIGTGLPWLDSLFGSVPSSPARPSPSPVRPPSTSPQFPPPLPSLLDPGWPRTIAAISGFVLVYYLSAVAGRRGEAPRWLCPSLWACSLAIFAFVGGARGGGGGVEGSGSSGRGGDGRVAGPLVSLAIVSAATAVCGPLVELFLIERLRLYSYADRSLFGAFPVWIAAVYFAGGPAVGALGRRVRAELAGKKRGRRDKEASRRG